MKIYNCIFILIIFFFVSNIYSQDYIASASIGYGLYNMSSLKGFQKDILNNYQNINLKTVDSFPPFFNYQMQITNKISSRINLGIFFEFLTTGGRNTVSDYSGEFTIDQVVNGYNAGILIEGKILEKQMKNLYFVCQLSAIYSTLLYKQYLKLGDQTNLRSDNFSSLGIGLEPGVAYEIISSFVNIRLKLGFNTNLSQNFHLDGNSSAKMNIYPDWTGLRFGISVGYAI